MRRDSGQSLSEYALIGALVTVVSISGLGLLGGNLQGGLQALVSDMLAGGPAASQPDASGDSAADSGQPGGASASEEGASGGTPTGPGLSLTTSDGKQIFLPNYPADPASAVQTMGANGATNLLADSIKTVAEQALAAGEITESQYNQLIGLAQKGHALGDIAALYEQASAAASGQAFGDYVLNYKGQPMTILEMKELVGPADSNYNYDLPMPKNTLGMKGNPEYEAFRQMYLQSLSSGALDDPAIRSVVEASASNILSINLAMDTAGRATYMSNIGKGQLNDFIASTITHQNSANICQAGNGTDTGISCSN